MAMIKAEGGEWECCRGENNSAKYRKALSDSITYVVNDGDIVLGYSRSLND